MNKHLRNTINAMYKGIETFGGNFTSSLSSILRMLVLSKYSIALKSKSYSNLRKHKNCTILANGPSLKEALSNGEVMLEGSDVFAVNMFVQTPEFWSIKPRFYFIADGAFFAPKTDRHHELIRILADSLNKVNWEISLCISSGCINGGLLKELTNPFVKVIRWNTSTFEGFRWLCHFMYRHNLGMPRCQTVTNMALTSAINMGYRNIYLYGADHSWTRDLMVDENNAVCYGDRHVYSTNLTMLKYKKNLGPLLHEFAWMFDSHYVIREYADSVDCNVINCTKGSFIDAYERPS